MRYITFSLLLAFWLTSFCKIVFASEYEPSSQHHTLAQQTTDENFYTKASKLIQQELDLIARIEQALVSPDANRMRAVRGQLVIHTTKVADFLQRTYGSRQGLCNLTDTSPVPEDLHKSQITIYCVLSSSRQELLKLVPMLDILLSRRGELGVVRGLPLISGEHQSDPVLSIAPIQRPNLGKVATPLATREPDLASTVSTSLPADEVTIGAGLPIIGSVAKTAIANYVPPMQPAIAPPQSALDILGNAKRQLTAAQIAFPPGTNFTDALETRVALDRFAYGLTPQEEKLYAKFLQLPRTGVFRILPVWAYERPRDSLWNRLQPSVSQRYSFPKLGNTQGGLNPSLTLQLVGDKFQLQHRGVDYSFMVDVGDVPLEKLRPGLENLDSPTKEFFLNYQPPKQLAALQVERRRFITGKDQNWNLSQVVLTGATAKLNHTYLVRSLQFQLPEIILNHQISPREKRRYLDLLQQVQSSDVLVAFRVVRQRSDGSYTVLWRVIREFPTPLIRD